MEKEPRTSHSKKRRSEKQSKENGNTDSSETSECPSERPSKKQSKESKKQETHSVDGMLEPLSKKQNKGPKKQNTHKSPAKSKSRKPDESNPQAEDNIPIGHESSTGNSVIDSSNCPVPAHYQIFARIGQLESHVAVLTNSVAELQRNQANMLNRLNAIDKRWSAVREAWVGQSNQDGKSAHKQKKDNTEDFSKKKKKVKKGKHRKAKESPASKTLEATSSDTLSSAATPPQYPDTSSPVQQDLSKRIRAALTNILHELPSPKKK